MPDDLLTLSSLLEVPPFPKSRRSGLPEWLAVLGVISTGVAQYFSLVAQHTWASYLALGIGSVGAIFLISRGGAFVMAIWRGHVAAREAVAAELARADNERAYKATETQRILGHFEFLKREIGRDLSGGLHSRVQQIAFPGRPVPMGDWKQVQATAIEFQNLADVIDCLPGSGELADLMRQRDLARRILGRIVQVLHQFIRAVGGDPQTLVQRTELVHEVNAFLDAFDSSVKEDPKLFVAKFRGGDRLSLKQPAVGPQTEASLAEAAARASN